MELKIDHREQESKFEPLLINKTHYDPGVSFVNVYRQIYFALFLAMQL